MYFGGEKLIHYIECHTYLKMNSQTRGDLKQKLKMLIKYKRKPVKKNIAFNVPSNEDEAFVLHFLNTMHQKTSSHSPKSLSNEMQNLMNFNTWMKLENKKN